MAHTKASDKSCCFVKTVALILFACFMFVFNIEAYEYPRFITKPHDVVAQHGGSIDLVCHASGDPKPVITWRYTDVLKRRVFPAAVERRMTISRVDGDKPVLTIKKLRPDDQGIYTCVATNQAGTISTNISLIVENKNRPLPLTRRQAQFDAILIVVATAMLMAATIAIGVAACIKFLRLGQQQQWKGDEHACESGYSNTPVWMGK